MRRHLFLSLTQATFGEMVLGLRVAEDCRSRGEAVDFLAPAALDHFFTGTPFRHLPVTLTPAMDLGSRLLQALGRGGYSSLVLVDLTCILLTLHQLMIDETFLLRLPAPAIALDLYNMPETDLTVDHGPLSTPLASLANAFARRLLPVPFVRPSCAGAFDALPRLAPISESHRRTLREDLGLGEQDRLLLLGSSRYQYPEVQVVKPHERAARILPRLVFDRLASLGPRVHVMHLGPQPFAGTEALGDRYHYRASLPPERFQELLQSADLQLSFNTGAVTSMSAIAAGVPVLLGINSYAARTLDQLLALLPQAPSAGFTEMLRELVPVYPFRLWPQGYHHFLAPLMRDNPCQQALRTVEVLEEQSLVETCHALLFDQKERETVRAGQNAYCRQVRALPGAGELIAGYLS